jgi:hypothetical protein
LPDVCMRERRGRAQPRPALIRKRFSSLGRVACRLQ